MKKVIPQFSGLYGDDQSPYMPNFIHIEALGHRSKTYNWEIADHTHTDLFQLFVLTKGQGQLLSGGLELNIAAPCLITIPADHLHGFRFESDIEGEVITLSDGFLEGILKERPRILLETNQMALTTFEGSATSFNEILFVLAQLQRELIDENAEKDLAIRANFQLLFLKLYRVRLQGTPIEFNPNHRNLAYFQSFKKLVKHSRQQPLRIKQYAAQLGITQMHLNRVCHAVAQESALKVVQRYTLGEAKKYLLNTSYSIAEIAYFLNFNDPAYFNRLFKKWVGVTPGEFRKE